MGIQAGYQHSTDVVNLITLHLQSHKWMFAYICTHSGLPTHLAYILNMKNNYFNNKGGKKCMFSKLLSHLKNNVISVLILIKGVPVSGTLGY